MNKMDIILTVISVVFGFLSYYLKTKTNIVNKVAELIAKAEDTYKEVDKSGIMKKEFVVNELYKFIPTAVKPFISKELLGILVDNIFNAVEGYAKIAVDKATAKIEATVDAKIDEASKCIGGSTDKVIGGVTDSDTPTTETPVVTHTTTDNVTE